MNNTNNILDIYGQEDNSIFLKNNKEYLIRNNTGKGKVVIWDLFDDVGLVFNDFYMNYCKMDQEDLESIIEINHCKLGRYEYCFGNNTFGYLSPGDFSIGKSNHKITRTSFPLGRYYGISIFIREKISDQTKQYLKLFNIDICKIRQLASSEKFPLILRSNERINRIFEDMYNVKTEDELSFYRVKILELLLFLSSEDVSRSVSKVEYININNVKLAKNVQSHITKDIQRHYTIQELANLFEVSQSTLKQSFKATFGLSIYAYLKEYRLQYAQKMLVDTQISVADIAVMIGYENPNKFSQAYKKQYNDPPSIHRLQFVE